MRESDSLVPALPEPRARLASVLTVARNVISVELVASTLELERKQAAKLLSRWRLQGWLRRVGPGLYVSVPLELSSVEQVVADPWTLVPMLFAPCYLGGWTAAHHWELTEQLFNETLVFTTRRIAERHVAQGVTFVTRRVGDNKLFGLKKLWRGSTRVEISDPARTLIDMLAFPSTGGGIGHVAECLSTYLVNQKGDPDLLIAYAEQFRNGPIFKRLGYLAEKHIGDSELATRCSDKLTQGYTVLDPTLVCDKLITRWRLWVPAHDR